MEKVGAVLKGAQYKAGPTYLAELKLMLIEDERLRGQQRDRTLHQVLRALKRARVMKDTARRKTASLL